MKLAELMDQLPGRRLLRGSDLDVLGITRDPMAARPGVEFVERGGGVSERCEAIRAAVRRGAAVVCGQDAVVPAKTPCVRVADFQSAYLHAVSAFHGNPSSRLRVVGVRGIRSALGAGILEQFLRAAGRKTGALSEGTSEAGDRFLPKGWRNWDAMDLHGWLARAERAGASIIVADLGRNTPAAEALPGARVFDVLHLDSPPAAPLQALDLKLHARHTTFRVRDGGVHHTVSTRIVGRIGVDVMLRVYSGLLAWGWKAPELTQLMKKLVPVRGEMFPIEAGQKFQVFVDGADTRSGALDLLGDIRLVASGRILAVAGGKSGLDVQQRQGLGWALGRMANRVWVTDDDPFPSDPRRLAQDVVHGIRQAGMAEVVVELDRSTAIQSAIRQASAGDAVVILGKGRRSTQKVDGAVIPFDDHEEAKLALGDLGYAGGRS